MGPQGVRKLLEQLGESHAQGPQKISCGEEYRKCANVKRKYFANIMLLQMIVQNWVWFDIQETQLMFGKTKISILKDFRQEDRFACERSRPDLKP